MWRLDPKFGTYGDTIAIRADGTTHRKMMGSEFTGSWKRGGGGTYKIEPSADDDYARVRAGKLALYDSWGLIATFRRLPRDSSAALICSSTVFWSSLA